MNRPLTLSTGSTKFNQPNLHTESQTAHNSQNSDASLSSNSSTPIEIMSASSSHSVAGSEPSGPPTPRKGPIRNFSEVITGIYRSSFPGLDNIEHLQSLKLKTLITLVTTPFAPEVEEWISSSGIEHHRINVTAHKHIDDRIPLDQIATVMTLLNDETKRPVLMHCNKGRHRTGCMVATFSCLGGMDEQRILEDYQEFAQPKARDLDLAFIKGLQREDVLDAMAKLEGPVQPASYSGHEIGMICKNDTSTPNDETSKHEDSTTWNRKYERVDIRRVIIGPELPPSPPHDACKGSGFTVEELTEALSRIDDGRCQGSLTPQATPPTNYEFEP